MVWGRRPGFPSLPGDVILGRPKSTVPGLGFESWFDRQSLRDCGRPLTFPSLSFLICGKTQAVSLCLLTPTFSGAPDETRRLSLLGALSCSAEAMGFHDRANTSDRLARRPQGTGAGPER